MKIFDALYRKLIGEMTESKLDGVLSEKGFSSAVKNDICMPKVMEDCRDAMTKSYGDDSNWNGSWGLRTWPGLFQIFVGWASKSYKDFEGAGHVDGSLSLCIAFTGKALAKGEDLNTNEALKESRLGISVAYLSEHKAREGFAKAIQRIDELTKDHEYSFSNEMQAAMQKAKNDLEDILNKLQK
jgi:hypothetical protein